MAENAEQLMRSRYTAYVLGDSDYLSQTWQAQQRPADMRLDPGLKWLRLDILGGDQGEDVASVEFEARFLNQGRVEALHESSRFVREQGRWLYTTGDMLASTFEPWKPGRNEACPCGSGRKFKRCCGA